MPELQAPSKIKTSQRPEAIRGFDLFTALLAAVAGGGALFAKPCDDAEGAIGARRTSHAGNLAATVPLDGAALPPTKSARLDDDGLEDVVQLVLVCDMGLRIGRGPALHLERGGSGEIG